MKNLIKITLLSTTLISSAAFANDQKIDSTDTTASSTSYSGSTASEVKADKEEMHKKHEEMKSDKKEMHKKHEEMKSDKKEMHKKHEEMRKEKAPTTSQTEASK